MNTQWCVAATGLALCCLAVSAAHGEDGWATPVKPAAVTGMISEQKLAQVLPGRSTKAQVQSLLGKPWRIVQFNDCGMSMPGQADETWDYRGKDANGTYRFHIEFDDNNVAHLVAKIPDYVAGGKATAAKMAPTDSKMAMKM
jgi:outer membrane protein assembly factor BamE (lipoprotein component of BamABCDE complex)